MERNWVWSIRSPPPIDKKTVFLQLADPSLERNYIARIKFLILDETAPSFGHNIALAAVPIRVPEPPWLPIPVLEIQQKAFLIGGRIQGEMLLGVLFWDNKSVQFPYIAWGNYFVEQVFFLDVGSTCTKG